METNSNSFVYVRRGESERESNATEEGRDAHRDAHGDDGRSGQRFEGKVMKKKRGLRDVAPADKKEKHLSKFKRISERSDDSPDRDGERRRGNVFHKELSWKEIAERKESRVRVDDDEDFSGKVSEDRKKRMDKGTKIHFKGSKTVSSKFPAKRKAESDMRYGEGKRKKTSEPLKKRRHRLILQDHSDDDDYYVRPLPVKKDPVALDIPVVEAEKEMDQSAAVGSAGQSDQGVRKSSRVPKKKILEDFEDDPLEMGLIESGGKKQEYADGKSESLDSDSNDEKEAGVSNGNGSKSDPDAQDWNDEMEVSKLTKSKDITKTQVTFTKPGKHLTARQRSILLEKDGDANVGLNLIEFPEGLSHFSRRGGTKLTVEDRQAKKAEAASRRKQVVEKAAKEMQATAIQKILGQDSSRRKKEERLQKQREEIEQGKKAAAMEAPTNSVRWTIGPERTTVSWSQDAKLPEIFFTAAIPPPPQHCGAPSCTRPRKYMDSKSKLPLCSLQCYRAVNSTASLVST